MGCGWLVEVDVCILYDEKNSMNFGFVFWCGYIDWINFFIVFVCMIMMY